jgi:hypothetical protein
MLLARRQDPLWSQSLDQLKLFSQKRKFSYNSNLGPQINFKSLISFPIKERKKISHEKCVILSNYGIPSNYKKGFIDHMQEFSCEILILDNCGNIFIADILNWRLSIYFPNVKQIYIGPEACNCYLANSFEEIFYMKVPKYIKINGGRNLIILK